MSTTIDDPIVPKIKDLILQLMTVPEDATIGFVIIDQSKPEKEQVLTFPLMS